jgi:hypothetical protein
MLVSNTALAGFGCGLCSASFPHALNEKQTTMHIHNNKILRIANPPLFSGNFVPDTFSKKALQRSEFPTKADCTNIFRGKFSK